MVTEIKDEDEDLEFELVVVKWSWHDAQAMYPHWTRQEAYDAMMEVGDYLHERVVELGNEVLEQLLYEIVETKWGEE